MPGWNECSIYDAACRNQTCAHPTNPRNEVNYLSRYDTKQGTENGSTGSVSVTQTTSEGVPTYALTGLTRRHVEALRDMLSVARPVNSAQVEVIVLTLPALDKINTL